MIKRTTLVVFLATLLMSSPLGAAVPAEADSDADADAIDSQAALSSVAPPRLRRAAQDRRTLQQGTCFAISSQEPQAGPPCSDLQCSATPTCFAPDSAGDDDDGDIRCLDAAIASCQKYGYAHLAYTDQQGCLCQYSCCVLPRA